MSTQIAEPRFNKATGTSVITVQAGTEQLVIPVRPNDGRKMFKLVDEYGFENFAYYRLVETRPVEGIDYTLTPVTNDGSVGCQAVPEFPLSPSTRSDWDDADNADNADGKAFRSYVLEIPELPPGTGFTIGIERRVKYYYSIMNPGAGGGAGKYDRGRPLNIQVLTQSVESFTEYEEQQYWT